MKFFILHKSMQKQQSHNITKLTLSMEVRGFVNCVLFISIFKTILTQSVQVIDKDFQIVFFTAF